MLTASWKANFIGGEFCLFSLPSTLIPINSSLQFNTLWRRPWISFEIVPSNEEGHSLQNDNKNMKTPEHWRALPQRALFMLFVSILAKKSSKDVKISRRLEVVLWRHMTSGVMTKWLCAIYIGHTIKESQNGDLDIWPMTFKLDQDIIKGNVPAKF